jgi:uncharacterized protein (TIGR02391 family)
MTDRKLRMSFDPQTIEHLGVKMYSQIPNAIAELIANAYDADANQVQVRLYDNGQEKRIEVIDDGTGMDFDEINNKFLRIGRNRRRDGADVSPGGRKATGKKGLGKLALFGIGDLIEVVTIKEKSKIKIKFTLSWSDLKSTQGQDYTPSFIVEECGANEKGTTIILRKLRRESAFDKEGLAISLSKLFNCFNRDFKCHVFLNDDQAIDVNNELKFKNIDEQFKWDFPSFSSVIDSTYPHKGEVTGEIISTEKPLKPGLRGITLFANGRLVNVAEFFGIPESSHVFSYLAGWLNVDFVDNIDEDVISTNRQSLNWELPIISDLRDFLVAALRKVISEWRVKRNEANKQAVAEQTNIDTKHWLGTLPGDVRSNVQAIVESLVTETETPTEKQADFIRMVHKLVPEYPHYHWRHIHPEVQAVSKQAYQNEDYYTAFYEAAKRYANTVRQSSNFSGGDHPMMGAVFGSDRGQTKLLTVTKNYKRPNGHDFNASTIENIENGQRELSQGVIRGCRNPVAHEEHVDLRDSNLFSEKDCLDALSLLSHLFRRLDDAIAAKNSNGGS